MYKLKHKEVKAEGLFTVVREVLDRGSGAKIAVTGMSMYPFLREGIDSVELSKSAFADIRVGDITVILRDNGQFIMHRVMKKEKDCFYIAGDAQWWLEGPLNSTQLVAVVRAVWRNDKRIDCSDKAWKLMSRIWMSSRPFRQGIMLLIKIYGRLRRYVK